MKKKIAVIIATLALSGASISSSYAYDQSIAHEPSGMADYESMKKESIHQVESLNKAADLQLTEAQKDELIKVLTSYNEARVNAETTHESRLEDIEESYGDTIKNVLTPDQIDDLDRYNQVQLKQQEMKEKEDMERYEQEYRDALNQKAANEKGDGSGPTSPRNGENPEAP